MTGLQTYRCHKVVRAAKIVNVHRVPEMAIISLTVATVPDKTEIAVRGGQWDKVEVGGYYVEYDGGDYASFSPAAPFEAGYTAVYHGVENPPVPTVNASQVRDAALKCLADYFSCKTQNADMALIAIQSIQALKGESL